MKLSDNEIAKVAAAIETHLRGAQDLFGRSFDAAGLSSRARAFALIMLLQKEDFPAALLEAVRTAAENRFLERLLAEISANAPALGDLRTAVPAEIIRKTIEGEHQAVLPGNRGLSDVNVADVVTKAGPKIAAIRDLSRVPEYIGTGFLVAPDLLLTAAHVVWHIIDSNVRPPRATNRGGEQIRVEFHHRDAADPQGKERIVKLADDWLVCCSEPCGTPPNMNFSSLTLAASNHDFALIRLASRIGDQIGYLDIEDPPDVYASMLMIIVGYTGGNQCKYDNGNLDQHHSGSGRLHHGVNAAPGMSGGACLDKLARVVGIHEGSVTSNGLRYNRSVHVLPIRRKIAALPQDPLTAQSRYVNWLSPAPSAEAWKNLGLQNIKMDHPVLGRKDFQNWVKKAAMPQSMDRLAVVSGPEGSGKTFSEYILRAKLSGTEDILVAFPPEVTRTADVGSVFARLYSAAGERTPEAFRPDIGMLRHDLLPRALENIERLLRRAPPARSSRLWLFIDFGRDEGWLSGNEEEWMAFMTQALQRHWMRVVVAGISSSRQAEFHAILSKAAVPFLETLEDLDWKTVAEFVELQFGSKGSMPWSGSLPALKEQWTRTVERLSGRARFEAALRFLAAIGKLKDAA
jgi:V8-like Glu-specific endopeptidase